MRKNFINAMSASLICTSQALAADPATIEEFMRQREARASHCITSIYNQSNALGIPMLRIPKYSHLEIFPEKLRMPIYKQYVACLKGKVEPNIGGIEGIEQYRGLEI